MDLSLEAQRGADGTTFVVSVVSCVQGQTAEVVVHTNRWLEVFIEADGQTEAIQGRACRYGVGETPSCRSEPGYALIVQGFVEG